jgi:hypothetical protein
VGTFIKTALMSRKGDTMRPLPGMERIDKSKFTDPLADERDRTESRRRSGEQ